MEKKPGIGLFMKEYRKGILFFGFLFLVFAGLFYLYHLEWEAFWYGMALCSMGGGIVLLIEYVLWVKRHRRRLIFLQNIDTEYLCFPDVAGIMEVDYQAMIMQLRQKLAELSNTYETGKQESIDYYTVWAHQIKTPIAVMQMMLQAEDTKEHRELAAELFRIEQYVDMVLNYIRLGSDNTDYVFQKYDLNTLIKQSIHKYASQFIQKKLKLIYEPTDVEVLTDEKWFSFLLGQILSNAVKYTYEGSVTITVSDDKKLAIKDTGIGIAAEDLPRIFEKGFTGYNGRADKKSTGLGLYLCKMTAERLSIPLTVTSVPGQGSTFTLDLMERDLEVE